MKKILLLFILIGPSAWGKVCTLEEIRAIDTRRQGLQYSPYPLMTKALLIGSLLPYLPRLEATTSESVGFQTISFIGFGGWIYFGLKSMSAIQCEDPRQGGLFYQPNLDEILKFHYNEQEFFWKSYLWSTIWMLGIFSTSQYVERTETAKAVLVLPWLFSMSRSWFAFAEEKSLQLAVTPRFENKLIVLESTLVWNF